MRHPIRVVLCLSGVVLLSACDETKNPDVTKSFQDVNVIDESNLNDVMLTVADPNEAVAHFQRTSASKPDDIAVSRGLAISLVRAKRHTEGAAAWAKVANHPQATNADQVEYADALIRNNEWSQADQILDQIPPTHETFKRYKLEAIVADSNKEWDKADSFYETAIGLTTKPAGVMNNWGYSKLTRGDHTAAERLFADAIRQDSSLFTAKNNLALARAKQKKYTLPSVPATQVESAELLYTIGLSAIKQGDTAIGTGLLRDAVDTHPQHFEAAVQSLRAIENNVVN